MPAYLNDIALFPGIPDDRDVVVVRAAVPVLRRPVVEEVVEADYSRVYACLLPDVIGAAGFPRGASHRSGKGMLAVDRQQAFVEFLRVG